MAPFLYSIAIDKYGADYVSTKVGHEIAPGGGSKSIQLDHESKPHNPMINTGSILMSTLFGRDKSAPERKVSKLPQFWFLTSTDFLLKHKKPQANDGKTSPTGRHCQ